MDIKVSVKQVTQTDADTVLIFLFENNTQLGSATALVNNALGGILLSLIEREEFVGKANDTLVLYPQDKIQASRVIVVGLGKQETFGVEVLRQAAATGIKKARSLKGKSVATVLAGTNIGGLSNVNSAQAITEGVLLGLYRFHGKKSSEMDAELPETLEFALSDDGEVQDAEIGISRGRAFATGANLTRELVNLPPNICTPSYLAERAEAMAKTAGLKSAVLKEAQMKALKMGALLGVAQGSDEPPRFIILEHNADRASELETVVLVGKGVTFDTGGYSLKTKDGMVGMKSDMGGGGAVIGAMRIIAALNLPLHVVGLIPSADNMINGKAYRPQDVVTASNGKTIEIISTDAEGRMLLADALVYAKRYEPSAVVDIATLTGACVTALGKAAGGVFCTDETLENTLKSAASTTNEKVWPLPLYPEYLKYLESDTADMKNTGGRLGGVGSSAMFLKNFVDYPVWAHIDMAGMVSDLPDIAYVPAGASGYGARLLAAFVEQWSQRKEQN